MASHRSDKICGCMPFQRRVTYYDDDSTSTSSSNNKQKSNTSKSERKFMQLFSPLHLFRSRKQSEDMYVTKIEISKYSLTYNTELLLENMANEKCWCESDEIKISKNHFWFQNWNHTFSEFLWHFQLLRALKIRLLK